ncbi:MAG: hypothetical protein K0U78_01485 [Actinomycetia bacterium]|nr:hypothetical protein [Actinomycetes bacterium]
MFTYLGINSAEDRVPRDLKIAWAVAFGGLVAAFPVYTYLVFALGMDRGLVADILALQVAICYWLGPLAALLPLRGLRRWTLMRRIHMVVVPYLIASVLTHFIWEGLWVLLHESISASRSAAWAYPWWGYIDGGDFRYYNPTTDFLSLEVLSVINGVIGAVGLFLLFRSQFQRPLGTMMVMTVAVVETVLTWYYYLTEILSGFANVNPTFMDLGVKFIFLNAPWLVFPWFVLYWGYHILRVQFAPLASEPVPAPSSRSSATLAVDS